MFVVDSICASRAKVPKVIYGLGLHRFGVARRNKLLCEVTIVLRVLFCLIPSSPWPFVENNRFLVSRYQQIINIVQKRCKKQKTFDSSKHLQTHSQRIRLHPNGSKVVQMHSNGPKHVQTRPKPSNKFTKTSRKLRERGAKFLDVALGRLG